MWGRSKAVPANKTVRKENCTMKKNGCKTKSDFATNEAGLIKAKKPKVDAPKATVRKGKDLRAGK